MNAIVTQMIILFLLVIVGYYLSKKKMMDADFDRKLSDLVINVTCPCLILASVMGDTLPDKNLILPLLIVGFATYVILIGLAFLLPRYMPIKPDERGIYSFMLAFGNVGFIGYPIYIWPRSRILRQHSQLSQHVADIRIRHPVYLGWKRQITIRPAHPLLPGHDSLLSFHIDCRYRLASSSCDKRPLYAPRQCNRTGSASYHRLGHGSGAYQAYVRESAHLSHGSLPTAAGAAADTLPVASVPGTRNDCRHQCGIGGYAGRLLRDTLLH